MYANERGTRVLKKKPPNYKGKIQQQSVDNLITPVLYVNTFIYIASRCVLVYTNRKIVLEKETNF